MKPRFNIDAAVSYGVTTMKKSKNYKYSSRKISLRLNTDR